MRSMVVHTTSVRKGTWTEEEDVLLKKFVEEYGEGKWRHVPSKAGLNRCRKSCRLRWLNYLRPNIKRGEFSIDEVDLLIRLHRLLGNRWSLIAGRIPGRTANDVKNYWNSHLSKKLLSDHKNISSLAKHHPIPHISAMKNSEWFNSLSSSQSSFNNQRADHKDDEKTKGEGEGGQSCVWSNIELDATQNDTSMRTEDKSMVMDDGDLFMGFEDLIPDIWGVLGQ